MSAVFLYLAASVGRNAWPIENVLGMGSDIEMPNTNLYHLWAEREERVGREDRRER